MIITAASSSVGLAAIRIANGAGAAPIATTQTSAKKSSLRHAGAAHVIATESEDLVAEVMRITDGRGARIVFDSVVGPQVETLAQAMSRNGILFIYGSLSVQATPFPYGPAATKALSLRGYTLFELTGDPQRLRLGRPQDFINGGLEAGQLKPIIAKTFAFDQIVKAHRYLESNQQIGKSSSRCPGRAVYSKK